MPFHADDPSKLQDLIDQGRYGFPQERWRHIAPSAQDLIKQMLQVDPRKRIPVSKIPLHSWFKGFAEAEKLAHEFAETAIHGVTSAIAPPSVSSASTATPTSDRKRKLDSDTDAPQPVKHHKQDDGDVEGHTGFTMIDSVW